MIFFHIQFALFSPKFCKLRMDRVKNIGNGKLKTIAKQANFMPWFLGSP